MKRYYILFIISILLLYLFLYFLKNKYEEKESVTYGENVVSKSEILESIKYKYSTYIYKTIVEDDLKNMYLEKTKDGIYLYFDSKLFSNIDYPVYLYYGKSITYKYKKVVAFTFDDGPSEYTNDLIKTLTLNNSKATFFLIGNKMNDMKSEVRNLYNYGMEIGSHSYSHENLLSLNKDTIMKEVNSTNIIFNEITGSEIKIIRPPYGNYNDFIKYYNMPIILWNIDTRDWHVRDSKTIYNHILKYISDGSIILMHEVYPETIEAVKMVLPVLTNMGYKVTTVSELAEIKNIKLEQGKVYLDMK